MSKPRIYLAGPMSGLTDFNYPAFNAEAARLRFIGYHVENPAENPVNLTWLGYMRTAITQMVTCDAVALLPGWENSRGAKIENALAISLGLPTYKVGDLQPPTPKPDCWLCEGHGHHEGEQCHCLEVTA